MGLRRSDWQTRLQQQFDKAAGKIFSTGIFDCCTFPCDCVEAMTGKDPMHHFRGNYTDRKKAYKMLKEFAGGDILETAQKIADELGCPEVQPAYAQRGDIVVCDLDTGQTLGIVDLSGREVVIVAEHGILRKPFDTVIRAWRV